ARAAGPGSRRGRPEVGPPPLGPPSWPGPDGRPGWVRRLECPEPPEPEPPEPEPPEPESPRSGSSLGRVGRGGRLGRRSRPTAGRPAPEPDPEPAPGAGVSGPSGGPDSSGRRPAAQATLTASIRLCTSSLPKMLRVWVRT